MLLDFTVSNFGPFKEEAVLSMQGTRLKALPDNVLDVEQVRNGLLSSALVFGANASGKTYLFKALKVLKLMVSDAFEEGFRYPWYEPFRNMRECLSAPCRLGIRLIVDDVLYEYSVGFDSASVVEESLHVYPHGRRRRVFIRTAPIGGYAGGSRRIQSMVSSSSTYLAVASKLNDGTCNALRNAISGIILLDSDLDPLSMRSCTYVSEDPGRKRMAIEALRRADLGISDYIKVDRERDPESLRPEIPPKDLLLLKNRNGRVVESEIYLKHDFDESDVDKDLLSYPLSIESAGTRSMLGLMGPLVDALMNGGIVVIDDMGADLHPLITRWIVRQFSAPGNPNRAQLIANTHDLGLLDQELLRRDQIWFVNKNRATGAGELYSLSDFDGVKDTTDILKAYLFGRYDAVPSVRSRSVIG